MRRDGPIVTIVNDVEANFSAEIGANFIFLKTNWKAPLGRIMGVDLAHPDRDQWREIIPEAANPIDHWALSDGAILVEYLANVTSQLYAFRGDGHLLGPVPIGDTGSIRELRGSWNQDFAYVSFESYIAPPRISSVRARVARIDDWWKSETPFASDSFETQAMWFPSKDGTNVPMLLALKKGL